MKTYYDYRKQIYASINGRKGNLITLSKSKLLKEDELEIINKIINDLEELRLKIKSNNKF